LEAAKREALAAFGSDAVLLERYLKRPRHIEFQVLADMHGNIIHVGERECSIQRRHQKILEEAPSVALTQALRTEMGAAAARAAQSVNYVNAGTCEFMLDAAGKFYFLEMNARLQVEHPVTELVYGIDLVHWQLRIANGEKLSRAQESVQPRGWAIETRIYAEDPGNHMLPSTGTLSQWSEPRGPGIRVDEGVGQGSEIGVHYDPMLAKLIVWAETRASAIERLKVALDTFTIAGIRTNVPLLAWIARDSAFADGDTTTHFLEERLDESAFAVTEASRDDLAIAAGTILAGDVSWRIGGVGRPLRLRDGVREFTIEAAETGERGAWRLTGDLTGVLRAVKRGPDIHITLDGEAVRDGSGASNLRFSEPPSLQNGGSGTAARSGSISSPMPGKIVKIAVQVGDTVRERALLVVLEAMKMEHRIEAPGDGTVQAILVRQGDIVAGATPLVELSAP
ncbi:MAG: 3-methylcrotonyl-CoA carboxylase, partial [Candidatus Eremiobacteraeota bacterium]|nr:3-methylcrotonyl-CoA carboxylase [Candidatus Eremiobacteraeota bacterium]